MALRPTQSFLWHQEKAMIEISVRYFNPDLHIAVAYAHGWMKVTLRQQAEKAEVAPPQFKSWTNWRLSRRGANRKPMVGCKIVAA